MIADGTMDQATVVDQFIEVSKKLLTMSTEQQAKEYIARLEGDTARHLVECLWEIEKIQRAKEDAR